MDDKNMHKDVPFIVYESAQARAERTIKRLIIALIIATIIIFASHLAWIYAWTQYDYTSEDTQYTYTQDGEGLNNINTGNQGDIRYEPNLDN